MNVRHMLTNFLHCVTPSMHKVRRQSLENCILSAAMKNHLTVTSLGRGIGTKAYEKHRIKSADRLLSNLNLHHEIPDIYRQISRLFLSGLEQPVLLVDWSDMEPEQKNFLLRAALVCQGRSITVYEEVHPLERKDKPATHRQFLDNLESIIPSSCTPIVVTDAGFRGPWFRQLLELGWNYIGRVRNQTQFATTQHDWQSCKSLYEKASEKALWFNGVMLAKTNPMETALVLYKGAAKGRHAYNRNGEPRRSKVSLKAAKGADEPWLLATSLSVENAGQANAIVKRYGARMQIEESFRDHKSERFGLGMNMHKTRKTQRLRVLVLIGTLSCIYLHLLGLLARDAGLARRFQANTEKRRHVLSCVFLGARILATGEEDMDVEHEFGVIERFRQYTAEYAVCWAA
ncbi:IS4 family transposase [Rheinheimera sp. 1928-s]|uniref:IS4 family transposase n=1 Tax=Rheinheimera sp. 1928-s TaxID=3033803 RepID=UPI002637110D|nr:IS4 family transposase [Rheinheimera sp. 1928-s]MDF3126676.1 IS4 family transposase [Rheinheimera sp. 1928-s]